MISSEILQLVITINFLGFSYRMLFIMSLLMQKRMYEPLI